MIRKLLLILLFFTATSHAQWETYHLMASMSNIEKSRLFPLPNGGAMFFYYRMGDTQHDIFEVTGYNRYGNVVIPKMQITKDDYEGYGRGGSNFKLIPSDNGVIVVFDIEENWTNNTIVQYIDNNGNKLWGEFGTLLYPDSTESNLITQSSNGAGGAFVILLESDSLRMFHVQEDGTCRVMDNQEFLAGVRSSELRLINGEAGTFMLYFSIQDSLQVDQNVMRIDTDGGFVWDESKSLDLGENTFIRDVSVDSTGLYIASVRLGGGVDEIIVHSLKSDGNLGWNAAGMSVGLTEYAAKTDIELESGWNRGVAVMWGPGRSTFETIKMQYISAAGELQWNSPVQFEEDSLVSYSMGYANQIIKTGDQLETQDLMIILRERNKKYNVYYRLLCARIDRNGSIKWNKEISESLYVKEYVDIIMQGNNAAIIAVPVARVHDFVYMTQISSHGIENDVTVSISIGNSIIPTEYTLHQSYPNPFNSGTKIRFSLPKTMETKITVYSVTGREIAVLADGIYPQGVHQTYWDGKNSVGKDVASGVYIYRMQTSDYVKSGKMILLR